MQHKHCMTRKRIPPSPGRKPPSLPPTTTKHTHGRETLKPRDNSNQRRRRLLSAARKSRLRGVCWEEQERSLRDLERIGHPYTPLEPVHTLLMFILLLSCCSQSPPDRHRHTRPSSASVFLLQCCCALAVCVHPSPLMGIHLKISSCLPFQS